MNKKILTGLIFSTLIILFITIGISYAYFTANLTGTEETTTITVTGGSMNIYYSGGANINISNIIPSDNPAAIKTFTITGDNTTDIEMYYQINLVVEKNTFSENALKFKLISINTNSNGNVVPSTNELINIGTGSKTTSLGVGYFDVPTDGAKTHTYNLEIYFPNANYNQNIDQEKEINGHVIVNNYEPRLADKILAQGGGISEIVMRGIPDYNIINGISEIYAAEDEYGTSYYYRGVKNELDNNIIWGGFQWKIIRINGDGSVRLIYNGIEEQFITNSIVNDLGTNTQISLGAWNLDHAKDNKYLGYMYGGSNGVASTMRNGTTSAAATFNETDSNAKVVLDNWYIDNIKNKPFESDVVDNIFCNDRQLSSEVGGEETGPGYGHNGIDTTYATYYRAANRQPTLKCIQENDRFTVNNNTTGNGALTYSIGLITADEVMMAGHKFMALNGANSTNYLNTDQNYWTFSPVSYINVYSHVITFTALGEYINYKSYVINSNAFRPVVSISGEILVSGDGSATNPFIVN